jgi:Putative phage metallopeptidase
MAKYHELFEDNKDLFTSFIQQIDSLNEVNIKVLGCNTLKEICKVQKATDILKHMTNDDVIILLNENIFEQLDAEQKNIVIEENVARIYFDSEKEKIVLIKPDVNTFSLLLRKYGYNKYERTLESIKALYAQKNEENAQANVR